MSIHIRERKSPKLRVQVHLYDYAAQTYSPMKKCNLTIEITNGRSPKEVGKQIIESIKRGLNEP